MNYIGISNLGPTLGSDPESLEDEWASYGFGVLWFRVA